MRRMLALLAAVGLVASLGPASVVAAPTTQPNSFHGDFDLLDDSGTQYLGHIVVDFGEVPNTKGNVGSLDVTWAAGGSSHGQLTWAEFGQQANDEWNVGALRWGWVKGTLCDKGTGGTSCNPFAMMAQETLSPTMPNFIGWSVPGSSKCCGGDWDQVGRGAFVLNYLGPAGKVTTTMVGPTGTMQPGDPRTFSATVRGAADTSVDWRVVEPGGGTITQGGIYTAPETGGTYTVMATSQADVRASATVSVSVVCGTPTAIPATAPPGGSAKFEPPDGSAYFGFMYRLWESDDPAWGDTRAFPARICDAVKEELAGKTPTTLAVWNAWQSSDGTGTMQPFSTVLPDIERIHAALGPGVVPLVEWTLGGGDWTLPTYTGPTTKDVVSGSLDGYIRQYARDVKRYGQPLFIRLICGEFNGSWWASCSPNANPSLTRADFVNAWRRVVDIFHQQGVTNVAWLWNPVIPPPAWYGGDWDPDWEAYYPGDAYVDWVGADFYQCPPEWLDPVYSFATTHGKPVFIAEFGIRPFGGDVSYATRLTSMFAYIASHPAIKAFSYSNYKSNPDPTWADPSTHTYLYDDQVNYITNAYDDDGRLLAGGPDIRALYASLIGNPRYVSTLVTGP